MKQDELEWFAIEWALLRLLPESLVDSEIA